MDCSKLSSHSPLTTKESGQFWDRSSQVATFEYEGRSDIGKGETFGVEDDFNETPKLGSGREVVPVFTRQTNGG